jgi:integrase
MAKLTKRSIETIRPGDCDVFLWDDTLPGFGVRVLPSGKRSFVLQYRNRERRSRRITLGRFGVLTVQQARQRVIHLLAEVQDGKDPAEERRREASAPVLADLAARYLRDHAEPKKKPRSAREDRRLLDNHILPALRSRKVRHITSDDMDRLHGSMRDTPIAANRVLALLSMMFVLSERWGMRPKGSNPTRGVERFKENRRERYLSMDEFGRLGATLRKLERERAVSPYAIAAVRLLMLTGARRNEICQLGWSNVDFERRELRLEDSKTGPKTIPLNAPALQILAGLERYGPWVLPGARRKGPIILFKSWEKIRTDAKLEDVRLHDLRHHADSWIMPILSAAVPLQVDPPLLIGVR